MKKICMILFTAALAVSFAACSGAKKEEPKAPEQEEVKVEVKEAPAAAPTVTPEEALKSFEGFAKKYVDVINKMKTGDTKIIQEYSTLSAECQDQVADMERLKVDFTPAQTKRYTDAQAFIAKALKSWQGK